LDSSQNLISLVLLICPTFTQEHCRLIRDTSKWGGEHELQALSLALPAIIIVCGIRGKGEVFEQTYSVG
jgi:hypothetical protein